MSLEISALQSRDFPGGTAVKSPHFPAEGMGLLPGGKIKILYALQCSQKIK